MTASRNFDVLGLNDDELMHEESLLEALLNHEPDTLRACIEERLDYVAKERVRRRTPSIVPDRPRQTRRPPASWRFGCDDDGAQEECDR